MPLDILKGFLIGMCASVPLGPIAILTLQKSLCNGHKAGFLTGLGATTVDTSFAVAAVFALSYVQRLMDDYEGIVLLCGGVVLVIIGLTLFFNAKAPLRALGTPQKGTFTFKDYLKAVAMGYSNPGAILVMFGLFASFGVDTQQGALRLVPVIAALSLGSMSYWFCFSWGFSNLGRQLNVKVLLLINRLAGAAVGTIGVVLFVRGLMQI